jgi:AcrR family transcriptional regulator
MQVKERIIEESVDLFRSHGVRHTTMDDIAKHIGISKRTIYENFKDKESLLIEVVSSLFHEHKKSFNKIFTESENILEAMTTVLKKGVEHAHNNHFVVFEDIKKYYPDVYKKILVCNESEKRKDMEDLILLGVRQGVFRDDLNPEIISYIVTKQSEGLFLLAKEKDFEKYSMHDVFKNMTIAFMRGLCTLKGIEILEKLVN